jgi:uncharacterized protein YceK
VIWWILAGAGIAIMAMLACVGLFRLVIAALAISGLSGCATVGGVTVGGYGVKLGVEFRRPLWEDKQIAAYVARHDGINDPKEVARR